MVPGRACERRQTHQAIKRVAREREGERETERESKGREIKIHPSRFSARITVF